VKGKTLTVTGGVVLVALIIVGGIYALTRANKHVATVATHKSAYKSGSSLATDLGVKFNATPNPDLVYVKQGTSALFSSDSLIKSTATTGGGCDPEDSPLGSIQRINKSSLVADNAPGSSWLNTASGLNEAVKNGGAKDFSTYYLIYLPPQGTCSATNNSQANNEQTSQAQQVYGLYASSHQ